MRELILKFKHWLIKKLGGYTEQHIDNRTITQKVHRFNPIKLRSEMCVYNRILYDGVSEQYIYERFKREMAYQIAEKLIEGNMILISCCDDPLMCQRKYVAELNIIHPHDASMCFPNPI